MQPAELMYPPPTILAAIDLSEPATVVAHEAIEMARRRGASELHLLHVSPAPAVSEEEREARRRELVSWIDAQRSDGEGVPESVRLVGHRASGDAAEVIVQMASDLLADVVVVGTHGRKGVERLVMGSVAESVVRNCGCPVLVARPKGHHDPAPRIEPPCPRCVEARVASKGERLWCDQHLEKHGRRHTYYNTRLSSWVNARINP